MNDNDRLRIKGAVESGPDIFCRIRQVFRQFRKVILPLSVIMLPMALVPVVLIVPGLLLGQPSVDPYDPDVSPPSATPPPLVPCTCCLYCNCPDYDPDGVPLCGE